MLNRRELLKLAAAIGSGARAAGRAPNVLLLFTDDQRADTVSALGNPHIQTPNLDALARSGFVFRNAYCMGGNVAAVCLPSRNMLLSGRAFFQYGTFASGNQPNFPDSMNEAGYVTYHHGKLGNSAREIQQRFDHNKYVKDMEARNAGEAGRQIVDEAIEFLQHRSGENPFFLYLAFACPHDPRVAPQKYLDMYERKKFPLPKNYLPVHPFDNGEMTVRDELLASWPRTEDEIRRHLHEYYAVITAMDVQIGRLIGALKKLKLYDNTLILFSSDQGIAIGSHGLMGKQNLYEHSMKAPLIFSGPGIPKGRSDALVYLLDVFPTVVDLAGGRIPGGLDGVSLRPIIEGKQAKVRDNLFTAYRSFQRAVRDDRWKLICYPQINKCQLFDLMNDPDETRDLAGEPAQAARIDAMKALIRKWQSRLDDTLPLESANPRDPKFTPPTAAELEALRKKWERK